MTLTRPAPRLTIEVTLNHDAHLGNPLWVDSLPDLSEQSPEHLYIIYVPAEERDKVMGAFIEFWDSLEERLHFLFHNLAKTPLEVSNTLISTFNGTKQLSDAIRGLAEGNQNVNQERLASLMNRVKTIATKRNRIVHGHWVMHLRYSTFEGPQGVVLRPTGGEWVRVYQPISPNERNNLSMALEQKIDAKYKFDLPRIWRECETLAALTDDLNNYITATEF